jgi:SagB-type dehydrogenase family enzyme
MDSGLTFSLKPSVRLLEDSGHPVGLEEPGHHRLRLPEAGEAQQAFLEALVRGASSEQELCGHGASREARLELRYFLALLEKQGWLGYSLAQGGRVLATLEPLTRECRFRPAGEGAWRLSRFAWVRRIDGGIVLENPLGFGRVLLLEPLALELVGRLCRPRTAEELADGSGLATPMAAAFLALLSSAGAVASCGAEGQLPEDRDAALRQWEFHDLLFHSRSRTGRHGDPAGGTCRFLGDIAPLPGLKPPRPESIPLPEPCLPRRDLPFFQVLEARRSIRAPGPAPITLAQLGTFLHYVARVRGVNPADPGAGRTYEAVAGPCPGGGGLHELELYLAVSRCAGLEPGFYHYSAGAHLLEPWPPDGAGRMLLQAAAAMGTATVPDILFTLAARIQRVTWKYQTIAYALILKNTGVLFQQMYLVATALGLAPCAIGTGDTQLFARTTGLDAAEESSVGEFALSGWAT